MKASAVVIDPDDFAAFAGWAKRGVPVTGGFRRFFLNRAGQEVDSWMLGVGLFPPDTWGIGESQRLRRLVGADPDD